MVALGRTLTQSEQNTTRGPWQQDSSALTKQIMSVDDDHQYNCYVCVRLCFLSAEHLELFPRLNMRLCHCPTMLRDLSTSNHVTAVRLLSNRQIGATSERASRFAAVGRRDTPSQSVVPDLTLFVRFTSSSFQSESVSLHRTWSLLPSYVFVCNASVATGATYVLRASAWRLRPALAV